MIRWLAWALVLLLTAPPLLAEKPPKTLYNPRPAEGDLILPMPDEAQIVFRKVLVPGDSFWGDPGRIIQVGDGEGGIFEGLQRMQVSGSFAEPDGSGRSYYIGKYELTKGQFIAVMGMERYLAATGDSNEGPRLAKLTGKERDKALAEPLVFVPWNAMQAFIHRYNMWLFDPAHPQRLANLPKAGESPGFIRPPTELEWEYAARGGLPALKDGSFKKSLPFPKTQMTKYTWHLENAKHKLRSIGLRKPNDLGIYDILGNAQEACEGLFRPEFWQGQPGGLVARGGSVGTKKSELRSSRREEVEIYRWDPDAKAVIESRSYNTGIRLAIGVNVVRDTQNRRFLEEEYHSYHKAVRAKMPVGKTLDNLVAQASDQLTAAHDNLDKVLADNDHLKNELSKIKQDIDKAQERLDFAMRESARATARDLLRQATNLGRDYFKLESFRTRLVDIEKLSAMSTRYQNLGNKISAEIDKRSAYIDEVFARYIEDLQKMGEFNQAHADEAFKALTEIRLTRRAQVAVEVVQAHLEQYRETRRSDEEAWRQDFQETFKNLAD